MNLHIAIAIALIGCCITMPLFARYFAYMQISFPIKLSFLFLCLLIPALPVFTASEFSNFYGKYFYFAQHCCYFIFIFSFILLGVTLFRDFIWTVLHFISKKIPSPLNLQILNKVNLITAVVTLGFTFWALYEGMKVPAIKETTIYSEKVSKPKKIVVLSDLHINRSLNPNKIKGIVDSVNHLNPDAVLLVGDIIDDKLDKIQDTAQLLQGLKAKNGVFFVTGNHEFYLGYQQNVEYLSSLGFYPLENRGKSLSADFFVAGVPDMSALRRMRFVIDLTPSLSNAQPDQYRVLLSHTPTKFKPDMQFDLEVSGHTHGGQIFPFHVLSWLGNNKYLSGLYQIDTLRQLYVSKGAGQWGPQMRFFAPAEITVLNFLPEIKNTLY